MIEIQKITDVMQHLDGLKAVIFDLDDTLYGEKEYVKSGYHAISQILPQVEDAETKLWNAFTEKKPAIDTLLLSENIYSDALKQKCLAVYRCHQPNIHFYEGVAEMLIQLREKGLYIGIITDGRPEGQKAKIHALNLSKYSDCIIITDELGGIQFRKPCDISFRTAQKKWNIPFSQMMYVGDNVNKDFIAPEKLGMKWIHFNNREGIYATSNPASSSNVNGHI